MYKNPGSSISFGSGLIKDVGRDGDGIYRHISRDLRVPDFLTKGNYEPLSWAQVCKCLPVQNKADRVKANIIDTVVLVNAEPQLYLYTTTEGYISPKPNSMLDLRQIRDQFLNYLPVLQSGNYAYVAVMQLAGERPSFVSNDAFSNLCLGATPKDLEILQFFLPSKGDSKRNVTYRTDYWLDRNAQINMRTERIGIDSSITGSTHLASRSNMNRKRNEEMENWTRQIANRIQAVKQTRVVRMTLEFVQDSEDKIWLANSAECFISSSGPTSRSETLSSERLKRVRTESVVVGRSLSPAHGETELGGSSPVSRPPSIGRQSDARVSRGRRRGADITPYNGRGNAFSPNSSLFMDDSSLEGSSYNAAGDLKASSSGLFFGNDFDFCSQKSMNNGSIAGDADTGTLGDVPNSRLGREVPLAGPATAVFGSTQLKGCQGDFCHMRSSVLEDPSIVGGRQVNGSLSKFRRRLMESDTSQFGAFEDQSFGRSYAELDDAAAVSIILGENSTTGGEKKKSSRHKDKRSRHRAEEKGSLSNDEVFQTIPFRSVIQARQEMPHVKALLLRRKNKEGGEYFTTDSYQDLAVSGKLPAVYYTEVPVCQTCAQIYHIIDNARGKALQKIGKKREVEKTSDPLLGMQLNATRSVGSAGGRHPKEIANRLCDYGHKSKTSSLTNLENSLLNEETTLISEVTYRDPQKTIPKHSKSPLRLSELGCVNPQHYEEKSKASLLAAAEAIEGLTKLDVAELRTMQKPPAAVEVVLEAVMGLLTGRLSSFQDTRRLLGGGEAFLSMLRDFRLEDVSDSRLRMVEPYVDNPVFRPENVFPVSACAAKFCSWVLGVVQAARWQRHIGHPRTDFLPFRADRDMALSSSLNTESIMSASSQSKEEGNLTFIEKLEKRKAKKNNTADAPRSPELKKSRTELEPNAHHSRSYGESDRHSRGTVATVLRGRSGYPISREHVSASQSVDSSVSRRQKGYNHDGKSEVLPTSSSSVLTLRERTAISAAQKQTTDRLASLNKSEGGFSSAGSSKEFRCRDGITKMPYVVLGSVPAEVRRCNFIVIHDFFDTCDGTSIAFKPLVQRHGCQILCFNYPGQANTVWPRPSAVERQRGAKEPVLNNDWISDRLHELLQAAEQSGDMLLTSPFHLVGIGNGAAIAASFAQRWGSDPLYASSLRSIVSVNGFLYPDPQLSAIVHSAAQLFETTPHSRPDIPVSYWARYLFSDAYLNKINPNLALNIYTAVANPITNDGRAKISKGCLQHRDMRGGLAPDFTPKVKVDSSVLPTYDALDSGGGSDSSSEHLQPVSVPVVIIQSTEDLLVNASNVDSFLIGRTVKHLWSHQQNVATATTLISASDPTGQWVGKLSKGPDDYAKFNILGKNGLRMLLESTQNPRGAFVIWTKAGHAVMQEQKGVVLDLMDALCCPTSEYFGIAPAQHEKNRFNGNLANVKTASSESKDDVLFKLSIPTGRVIDMNDKNSGKVGSKVDEALVDEALYSIREPFTPTKEGITVYAGKSSNILSSDGKNETDPTSSQSPTNTALVMTEEPRKGFGDSTASDYPCLPTITVLEAARDYPSLPPITVLEAARSEITPPSAGNELDMKPYITDGDIMSTREQRLKKKWADSIPEAKTSVVLEKELESRRQDLLAREAALKQAQELEAEARIQRIQHEQSQRRQNYEAEDQVILAKLEADLQERRMERAAAERQRKIELNKLELKLVSEGFVEPYSPPVGSSGPVPEIRPQMYTKPPELPAQMKEKQDPASVLDQLLIDEEIARKKGVMSMEEFDRVKKQMALNQLQREQRMRDREDEEESAFYNETAITIQRLARGVQGRERARAVKKVRDAKITVEKGVLQFQALCRGNFGRQRARILKKLKLQEMLVGKSVIRIQCIARSFLSKKYVRVLRRQRAVINIQRTFRGHLGFLVVKRERARLKIIRRKNLASSKIQSVWRMKVAKEEFRSLRIHALAVLEIQRCYRGYLGRKKLRRHREWEAAAPGPERIKLGLQLIEESKVAFERQQEEIDALHRAQERAEARVSHIYAELKDSEKELVVLERELQEIDQIERDLQNLTHEKDLISRGIRDAAGVAKSAGEGNDNTVLGKPPGSGVADMTPEQQRKLKADAFALEMTIQIKRAEREKKRQELESEFATVFRDVEKKKNALERLEASLVDMESTRERKDREFRRLQQNLMQLLMEQKLELDNLREKGVELETATATSAAAATATAMKAKEHEKRSTAMFSQTEELMKFQFMSMSLSYFSSLNMLKQLRDMNADTTSAAVTSSAEAAAAAATSAIAANLPNLKKLDLKGADYVKLSAKKKKEELLVLEKAEKEVKTSKSVVMPNNVRMWTVDDVSKWIESLSLGQYAEAFREATVDGPFLLELREEDLVQVLGVSHKLHVRKILVSREKLKPLSEQERAAKEQVEYEEKADQRRKTMGIPDLETVFSQARNGRTKRLEESLNLGFPINGEDGKGNTLLLTACQNSNKRMVEMLVTRGANVNHQNAVGNTALHFCMSFDPEGQIGEYLIAHGADDSIENVEGLTPYDGLGTAGGNF